MSDRPVTPYKPFTEVPRSVTPLSVQATSAPPPSESVFPRQIADALHLIEQSITENVKLALQRLGTLVLAKQDETRAIVTAQNTRLAAHASELRVIREALQRTGTILPPPPDNL